MTATSPRLAVLTCIDARIDVVDLLRLGPGEANVIRNAGAVATSDALRSLVLSQRLRGTREVVVIGHTDCGLQDLDPDALSALLADETGSTADLDFGRFTDVDDHVRAQVEAIQSHPWVMAVPVRGLVYDVGSGAIRDVL